MPSIDGSDRFGLNLQAFTKFTDATDGVVDGPPLAQVGLDVFQRLGLVEPQPSLTLPQLVSTEFAKSGLVGDLDESFDTRLEVGFPNPLALA